MTLVNRKTSDSLGDYFTMMSRVVFTLATLLPALFMANTVAGDTCPEQVTLTDSVAMVGSKDSDEIIIKLSDFDLNRIKLSEGLAVSEATSFLSVTANAVGDMAGGNVNIANTASNFMDAIEHKTIERFEADGKKCNLLSYILDMETGIMSLTFDETVDSSRFNGAKLTLHKASNLGNTAVEGVGSHTFKAGSSSQTDSTIIDFTMDETDLHKLKLDTTIASVGGVNGNTFLTASSDAIADQAGIGLVAITADAAKPGQLKADEKKPELESFEFNVNTGTMILTFTEPVIASTFNLDKVRLANAEADAQITEDVSLKTGSATVSSINGLKITISDIAIDEMNDIKAATDLATSQANTVILLAASAVKDMNSQAIDSVAKTAKATPTADAKHPTLTGFKFSVDEGGTAELTFSESIDVGSLSPVGITLQAAETSDGIKEVTLSVDAAKDANDVDGPTITVRFSVSDGDAIKEKEFCTKETNCYIRITFATITDMVGKAVTAIPDGSAKIADEVSGDDTRPSVVRVAEVTREGKITIVFDEPIPPQSLVYTGLTLYSGDHTKFLQSAEQTHQLRGGSTESVTGKTLVIQMVDDDIDDFKSKEICTIANGQNCFVSFATTFATDIFTNTLNSRTVNPPDNVVLDTTPPKIDTYTLDMKTNFLKIKFDEPVKVSGFTSSTVKLQASATDNTASSYQLAANDQGLKNEADSRYVNVPLQVPDQIAIKALQDLGTDIGDTFVSMALGTVSDLADNKNEVVADTAADQADAHEADSADPSFKTFAIANPNTGSLRLKFNEPVDKATLDCTKLTLQRDAAGTGDKITLSNVDASKVTYVDETTKMEIDIVIHADDRATALIDTNLFTEEDDTYLKIDTGAIKDMAGNSLPLVFEAEKVDQFLLRDPAVLEQFTVDMNAGTIILTFSTVVKADTFTASKMTLQATEVLSSAGTHYVTLSDSAIIGNSGLVVTVKLSETDLNKITADRGLATKLDRSDSWLTFDANAILDNFDDVVTAIADTAGQKATVFTKDITPPEIKSWILSLDPAFLEITYTEQVDVTQFTASGLSIQSLNNDATVNVPLFGGSVKETDTSTVITYTFSTDNLNDLKFKDMATTTTDTWLVAAANHIDDMAGVGLKVIADSQAKHAFSVSVDSTPPTLEKFVLDMDAETLTMTFSESVLVSLLTQNKLTLRDGKPGTSGVTLSGVNSAHTQVSPTVLKIDLSLTDMNNLKADGSVARSQGSTFLVCAAGAVGDASSLGIEEITNANAVPATGYVADVTRPYLASFEFNVDAKTITLSFSETVDVSPFKVESVLVLKSMSASAHTLGDGKYQLTVTSTVQAVTKNSDTVVIDVSVGDMNAIKLDLALVVSEDSTWISFPASAVSDVDGNTVAAIAAEDAKEVAAGKLNADATGPVLVSFTIDLEKEELALLFDEPVDASELDVKDKLTLSVSASSVSLPNPIKHALQGGLPTGSTDGLTATLGLLESDLNAIKKFSTLATIEGNTWISMAAGAATDVASRPSLLLALSDAKKAFDHVADTTAPTANEFSMNMLTGTFKLGFTETIQIETIECTKLTLQIASSVTSSADKHTLDQFCTLISTEDGTEVEVKISPEDMNVLKQKSIANLQPRAHLTILSGAIKDMNNRPVNAVVNGLALNAVPHVKDNANPSISEVVSLSMHTGLLTLSFDETVRTSELQADKLFIQNRADDVQYCAPKTCLNNEYVFSAANTANSAGTAEFTVDTECDVCTECDIGAYETTACSANSNSVCTTCGACAEGTFLQTFCYGDSATVCGDCESNCKSCYGGAFKYNFCTECKPNYSLITTGLHAGKCFKSDKSEFGSFPFLDPGDNPSVYDDNGVFKPCHPLCSKCSGPNAEDCTKEEGMNWCVSPFLDTNSGETSTTSSCKDSCDSSGAGYPDKDSGTCQSCDVSCKRCNGPSPQHCISCHPSGTNLDGPLDYIQFSMVDVDEDKKDDTYCIPYDSGCPAGYRAGTGLWTGVSYNTCISCGKYCDECTETTGCTKCDNDSHLQLIAGGVSVCAEATEASETASLKSGNDPQVRYLADGTGTKSTGNGATRVDQTCVLKSASDPETYLLKTHVVDVSTATNSENGAEIVIALSFGDMNELKADVGIATSTSNTFIAFDDTLIDDMAANDVVARLPTPVCPSPCFGTCTCPIDSVETSLVVQDLIRPSLVSFDLDMDGAGKLTLVFSETVNQDTFKPEEMQIQIGDGDVSSKMTILGSSTTWTASPTASAISSKYTTAEMVPTVAEMNALKKLRGLAIDFDSTWLSLTEDAVKDMNDNKVHAILFNQARQVREGGYTPDTTQPELVSFAFNANRKLLRMVFSETVDASTITSSALTFQDAATASVSVPLTGEVTKTNLDSTVVSITLTDDDMDAIKAKYTTPMASDDTNTFLRMTKLFVSDMAKVANVVAELAAGNGMKVDDTVVMYATADVGKGQNIMQIDGMEDLGFKAGDQLIVDKGKANEEIVTIDSFGSVIISGVFKFDHSLPVTIAGFYGDITDPEIRSYDLNMHLNTLTITFTETVNLASLDETQLTFVSTLVNPAASYTLTDSAVWASSEDARDVVITLSRVDMNALKQNRNLAVSDPTTNLVVTTAAVSDGPGNKIVKIDSPGKNVNAWTPDTNKPVLESFTMNMLLQQIVLTFSETVDVATLKIPSITLQQKVTAAQGTSYTLADSETYASGLTNAEFDHIVVINLGDFDMNSIKNVENLAIAGEEIYISMAADAVRDMSDQPSLPINDGFPIKVTDNKFVADNAAPTLTGFDLNMNTATAKLSLTFSETVRASTLQSDAFTLVTSRAAFTGNNAFTLTLPTPSSSSALNVLNFDLSTLDMHQIKARTSLATDGGSASDSFATCDTFIWVKDYGANNLPAIKDMQGNSIAPIAAESAIRVSTYVADITPPELLSFSAEMVTAAPPILLTLVFNEPVKVANAMDVSGFVLQPAKIGYSSGYVPLTGAVISRDADLVTVEITISVSDLATIRGKESVGRSAGVTFASILGKFTTDEAGNPINVIATNDAQPVDIPSFSVDIVPPTLTNFELDLSTQKLTLSFSEVVALDTLTLGTFYLQATQTSNADMVTISTGSKALATNGKDIVISLTQTKVDEIKANGNLALGKDSTWIVIAAGAVEDTAQNDNIPIATEFAKEAFKYQKDNVPPSLSSFKLNMETGVFTMVFSEVMDIGNFDLSKMIIQNSGANPTLETVALAGDVVDKANAVDSTTVQLVLTETSANTARAIADLATSATDTFVRFESGFATDVDGVPINARGTTSSAKGCETTLDGYVADTKPPTAVSFEIDFNSADFSNMITIHFTQPVDSSTIDPKKITLQYDSSTTDACPLTGGTASGGLTTAIEINLIEADVNEIKRLRLCGSGDSGQNCFLHFGDTFGDDSEKNPLVALNAGSTVSPKSFGYKADNGRPYIVVSGFTKFDLNTGRLTLSFSETVDRNEFDAEQITLQEFKTNPGSTLTLSPTTMISTADGTSLEVELNNDDLDLIKEDPNLCTGSGTCYLIAASGVVADMAGNPTTATDSTDTEWAPNSFAQIVTTDFTGPGLNSFDLNMNKNELTLHFDETINHNRFDPKLITLQGGVDESFKFYTLKGGEPIYPTDGEYKSSLTVTLLSTDVIEIKLLEICRTSDETFLSAQPGMVADMNTKPSANPMLPILKSNAKPADAGTFVADATKPLLLTYTLNLDTETLILSFNEPVDATQTFPAKFTLQSDKTATPGFSRTLASATVITESPKTATNTITIQLAETDISVIKLDGTVGTSTLNTFLAFADGATKDTKGLGIIGLADSAARKADLHIEDSTFAELQSFDMNLELRTLTLHFDEIMNPETLVPSAITIRAAKNSDAEPKYTLTNSASSSVAGQVVVITLSNEDFLGLSLKNGLATNQLDTYLTLTVSALKDAFARDVLGVRIANSPRVDTFNADSGAPRISDSVLDMAKGELGLTFSEAVNKEVFSFTEISLQHVQNLDELGSNAPPAIPITNAALVTRPSAAIPTTIVTWAEDYRSVVLKLNDDDLDKIKGRTDLGTTEENTFLVFSGDLVADFAPTPNPVVEGTSSNALRIVRHEVDTVKPKLKSYGVNMDTGVFSLHFDETMQAEKIKMEKFRFQYAKDLTATDSSNP